MARKEKDKEYPLTNFVPIPKVKEFEYKAIEHSDITEFNKALAIANSDGWEVFEGSNYQMSASPETDQYDGFLAHAILLRRQKCL